MSRNIPATERKAVDAELAELHRRTEQARYLLHRCLIDIDAMAERSDELLEHRAALTRIEAAAQATMNPGGLR